MKKFWALIAVAALIFFVSCGGGDKKSDKSSEGGDVTDTESSDEDGDTGDTGTDTGNTEPDSGDTTSDTGDTTPDTGDTTPDTGDTIPDTGDTDEPTCEVISGNNAKLIKGNILSGDKVYTDGEVLIGADGFIVCAGDDCSGEEAANGATVIDCSGATVSPALINGHDHLGYVHNMPGKWKDERFDHRHEWRKGKNGHSKISTKSGASVVQKQWAELRQLMSGTLSITEIGRAHV